MTGPRFARDQLELTGTDRHEPLQAYADNFAAHSGIADGLGDSQFRRNQPTTSQVRVWSV